MHPEAFANRLNDWLLSQAGSLPQALALDGKIIRDHIGLLTLAQHEDGAPQAAAVYDQKEGTQRCEQSAAARLLEELPALDGKIITGDPLHCQCQHARTIAQKGDEYLFQIKGNQPKLLKQAQGLDALKDTPFYPVPVRPWSSRNPALARLCRRTLQSEFPFARTLIVLRSERTIKMTGVSSIESRYYLSSVPPQQNRPEQWLGLIRGHWGGVEIRNRWRRDVLMGEDRSRSRNPTLLANLALIRSPLLHILAARIGEQSLPELRENLGTRHTVVCRSLLTYDFKTKNHGSRPCPKKKAAFFGRLVKAFGLRELIRSDA